MLPESINRLLHYGRVIPAHPLALDAERKLDEPHQRALTRYYLDTGAGGIAVGVHTTQFEIRKPEYDLLRPVLELAANVANEYETNHPGEEVIRIAGICGDTPQAVSEARQARELGYHIGLLSLGALSKSTVTQLIDHAKRVASEIPLMGFYLQPSVGGRILSFDFWARFCEIPNVVAIKIAPFNRYQTLEVLRGVVASGRDGEIALYTGNDDTIVYDLLSPFSVSHNNQVSELRVVGGLLGHWAFWTRKAVEQHIFLRTVAYNHEQIPPELLTLAWQITDVNAVVFDASHGFAGCIPGINEILRRQGLLATRNCLNPHEEVSPGQLEEIDRVYEAYPHLNDDEIVQQNLDRWLS